MRVAPDHLLLCDPLVVFARLLAAMVRWWTTARHCHNSWYCCHCRFFCYGGSVRNLAVIWRKRSIGNFNQEGGVFLSNASHLELILLFSTNSPVLPDTFSYSLSESLLLLLLQWQRFQEAFLADFFTRFLSLESLSVSWANKFPVLPADLVSARSNFFFDPSFLYLRQSLVLCVVCGRRAPCTTDRNDPKKILLSLGCNR